MTGLFPRRSSLRVVFVCMLFIRGGARGADCNSNRVLDSTDLAGGTSRDCNSNGIPDECDVRPSRFGFKVSQQVPLGEFLNWFTVADLDGDKSLDIVTANSVYGSAGASLSILWNRGEGSLALPEILAVPRMADSVSTGDLDGDAKLDLVVAHSDSRDLTLIFNKGGRAFESPLKVAIGHILRLATTADLDGDQDSDLVLSSYESGTLLVLHNEGGRMFETPILYPGGEHHDLADLDGDGDIDIVVLTIGSTNVWALLNHGDGTFAEPVGFDAGDMAHWTLLSDLDGDRLPEIVVMTASGFSVLFNQGGGRFGEPERYPSLTPVAAGDFDADGDADLATAFNEFGIQAGVQVALNDGNGVLSQGPFLNLGFLLNFPFPVVAADLQGDGWPDLIMPTYEGVLISVNAGDGAFLEPELHPHQYSVGSAISADLNGDGRPDVALGCHKVLAILLNTGRGALSLPVGQEFSGGELVAGDLDGDEDLDLAAPTNGEGISVLSNRGDGSFGPRINSGPRTRLLWPALGDLDGDGDLDLALGEAPPVMSSQVLVLLNDGSGRFSEGEPVSESRDTYSVAAADLDGDGHVDLAAPAFFANRVGLYRNNKDGTFSSPRFFDIGTEPRTVTAADLDGDGSPDLAVGFWGPQHGTTGSGISVLLHQEGTTFGKAGDFEVGPGPDTIEAADLDGDGRVDLLAPASFAPSTSILLNEGDGAFRKGLGLPSGHAAISDLDGDGRMDVVLAGSSGSQHAYTSMVNVHLNRTLPPGSEDLDRDGVPDECSRTPFHRGDLDGDGETRLTDAVLLLEILFHGKASPACNESADADNSGGIEITDAIHLLRFLFQGGSPPAEPGPAPLPCGIDPDLPGSPGDLGCDAYGQCG